MLDITVKQMKYAVEIAHCGSINQAAQNLDITQSNLSKAMKDLEYQLGYSVFQRTPAGTTVTDDGQLFLHTAQEIIYSLELMERQTALKKQQLAAMKISIPRATYISYAFTQFFRVIQDFEQIQITFSETNSEEAVDNILYHGYQLGILRFPEVMEENIMQLLQQKKLRSRPIWTFDYMLLASKESPLSGKTEIAPQDLIGLTELVHGDEGSTFLPEHNAESKNGKHIYLYERGSQFDFLGNVPSTYMWVSPLPQKVLQQHGLIQLPSAASRYRYKDILIYHEDYPFTGYAKQFYDILLQTKDEIRHCL